MLAPGTFTRLCRAREILREQHELSIAQVASETAVSRFHFIRQFRALFGETPHQFRIAARLERARHLLAATDYSVTRVCIEIGFASIGSFSALFARRFGLAPTAYRQRVRAMTTVPRVIPKQLTPGCLTLMGAAFAIFEKSSAAAPSDSLA